MTKPNLPQWFLNLYLCMKRAATAHNRMVQIIVTSPRERTKREERQDIMDKKRISALMLAVMLALAASGCQPTYENNEGPEANGGNDTHTDQGQYDTDYGTTGDDDLSHGGADLPDGNKPVLTPNVDLEKLQGLSAESKDWGPGGPRDDKNRSQSALLYNKTYGAYDAMFISEQSEKVYLTFDEGYEYGLSDDILDTLKAKGIKAMFFITADFAKSQPELVQRMIDEGHTVGNHSWTHKNYSTLTAAEAQADVMELHNYVKDTFGYEMRYFRFPSGNFTEQALAAMQQLGYKSVFWSFAYKDWLVDDQPDPTASLSKITEAACPGMIYLLHAVSQTNSDILGQVIDGVTAKGFTWGDPSAL